MSAKLARTSHECDDLNGSMSNQFTVPSALARRMRAAITILCVPIAVGLAVWLGLERRASLKLNEENNSLRRQWSQMPLLFAENQRLSNLVAEGNGSLSPPNRAAKPSLATDESAELVRLRGEVKALQEQNREIQELQANTRETRAAAETATTATGVNPAAGGATSANGSGFELLGANYWTGTTNLDVTAELRKRIRADTLKAIASNNLKGDPEFGQTKHLTVVYRVGGVTMTNEFREGDVVVLPNVLPNEQQQ